MKDSFVLFTEYRDTVITMDNESAGILFKMILNYEADHIANEDIDYDNLSMGEASIAFTFIRRQLDRTDAQYEEMLEKKREAGRKGAGKRWGDSTAMANNSTAIAEDSSAIAEHSTAIADDSSECHPVPVHVHDKEKETSPYGEEKKESAKRFRKPTLEEVREYCQQRGNNIEPQVFLDFYESVGWKVGTKPMKDWKACVRTWEQRRKERARSGTTNKFTAGIVKADYSDFNEEEWIAN